MLPALLAVLAAPMLAFAEPNLAAPPLLSYSQRIWKMQDGLPEQVVQAFAQTADRYLWIGTTGGLLRFDGQKFLVFDRENTPAFVENNVFCLLVSRDNTLWIGMEGGGLIRYRDGAFRAYTPEDGLTNAFVRTVYEDSKNRIWAGTDSGLFLISGDRTERVDNTSKIPSLAVHALYEDRRGALWAGGSHLLRIEGSSVTQYQLPGEASQNRVKTILESHDGTVWVGTVSGLQRFTTGSARFVGVPEVRGTVRFLRETSDHTLWIGTIGRGLHTYHDNHFSELTAPDHLPSNTVLNLFEDAERNIWIGTQGGMVRLSKTPVRTVSLPDAADSDAETVYQDHNGDLWVAAVNLFRVRDGKATPYHFPEIAGVRIRNVFRDRDGALWIGTEGRGAYRQTGAKLTHYSTKNGLVNNFIRAFLQSRDGSIWITTDEGVSRWRPEGLTNFEMRDGLCYFSTRSILEDHNGDIWIGTDRGISRLRGGKFEHDAATDALKHEKVWAIHEDPTGAMWFGTRTGGLYRWGRGKLTHYTTAQGLAGNGIYELLEDHKGNLWMSGPHGISSVSRHELEAVADNPSRPVALTLYGVSEGLETIQMCGGEKPAGILTSNGELWFPSSKGPLRVFPDQLRPLRAAPVVIDAVIADGRQLPSAGELKLGPDNAKLEVHFGVVLLRSQEQVRFRYMLEGFDKNWSEPSLGRVAYYTNLSPGRYRFHVTAFEINDPEQVAEATVSIVQKPHFYRTWWFLALCVALAGGLAWVLYQVRLAQLRSRFQAVLDERSRLAREMHDTLIQGCVGVSALLEAQSSLPQEAGQTGSDLLDFARTQLRSTIDEARQAVWNLRQNDGTVSALTPQLERMAGQISHEFGVAVECRSSGKPLEVDQTTAHEVLMVAREALHNAVRHAHPSRVTLDVCFDDMHCRVRITDDGGGFDPALLASSNGHYGLVGMRERVVRIGGSFTLNSQPGSGTEVIIRVPCRSSALERTAPERSL